MATIIVGRGGENICCKNCRKDINKPQDILKYKDDYFCDETCLGEYLVSQVEDEVEEVWADTEENMYMCAMEAKSEW